MPPRKKNTDTPDQLALRPGRAVAVPLKGGGLIMFSCTAELADEMEERLGLQMEEDS